MKAIVLVTCVILIFIGTNQSDALQQVAGPIVIALKLGETKVIQWGLVSDKENDITTVEISAEGEGAQFLSFPKTVDIEPGQLVFVDITVTIPHDYPSDIEVAPIVTATEFGEKGGATVMNIQMKKTLSIIIGTSDVESKEEISTSVTEQEKNKAEGGGCLIATATYDSELSPQVQMLRELRDNTLLKTSSGSAFMIVFNSVYYSFSPTVADWERQNSVFKEIVKATITPLISTLSLLNYVDINSDAEMLGYGIGIIILNIGMYFAVPVIIIAKRNRQKIK